MGLPCRHEIARMKEEGRNLRISDIYEFWWYDRPTRSSVPTSTPSLSAFSAFSVPSAFSGPLNPPTLPALLVLPPSTVLLPPSSLQNPPVQPRKERPKGTTGILKISTRRYASHFEIVDAGEAAANKRRRQRSPSPDSIESQQTHGETWKREGSQLSHQTQTLLALLLSEAREEVDLDEEEERSTLRVRYKTPPDERAAYELERQRREAAGGEWVPPA